jgi:hypothetical protein
MDGPPRAEDDVMKQFLTALQAGLILFAMSISGTGWAAEAPVAVLSVTASSASDLATHDMTPDMTGAYFMRDSLVPRADDLALLQRKPALYLASFNDGMATVAYSLEQGRIVYRVVEGELDAAARQQIDRALPRLQRKLA